MKSKNTKNIKKSRKRFYILFLSIIAIFSITIYFIGFKQPYDNINLDGGFVLGQDYERINDKSEYNDEKTHIVEFFSYGCPHCRSIDNNVIDWISRFPDNIIFEREHPSFGYNMDIQAKTYYVLKDLGLESKYHKKIMNVLNKYTIGSSEEMALILEESDKDVFIKKYFENSIDINKANRDLKKYSLIGVPSFVINGEFVTGPQYIRNPERLYELFISFNKYYQKNKK